MRLVEGGSSRTDWSLVEQAGSDDSGDAAPALERLMRRYWPAVYAYVRSTGRNVHEAADLTQGFVCDVLMTRRLCAAADPQRGRFRSLLLTAIKNYIRERHRAEHRQCRDAERTISLRLDEPERAAIDRAPQRSPESAFSYEYAATLVRRVLEQVRSDCERDELVPHWTVFEQRIVRPMLFGEPPADYDALVARLDLRDASHAANMMVTIKRRFAAALCHEVARTVSDPAEIKIELQEILKDLEGHP